MDEPTVTPDATPWAVSYRPGDWTVLAAPAAIVVLEPAPARASAMVGEVWQRVLTAGSVSELTARLAAVGLDSMPTLGVVFRDAAGLHALLRGAVSLLGARDEHLADGADAGGWRSVDVPGDRCTLRLQHPDPGLPELPVATGVVRAAEIVVDASPGDAPTPVQLYPVEPQAMDTPAPEEPAPEEPTSDEPGAAASEHAVRGRCPPDRGRRVGGR